MSYQSAIDHLAAMAPELATQTGQTRRKFSLDEVAILLSALGNPQRTFPSVLIAGTNGKGSTAATLASILTASGLRTGLYTSPHLARPNERIRIDGAEISDDDFAENFFRVRAAAQKLVEEKKLAQAPSFFETLTAMAFLHFARTGHRNCSARSGPRRPPRRHQHCRSAALDHHRHLARPHGVARHPPSAKSPAKKPASFVPAARSSRCRSIPRPTRSSAKSPCPFRVLGVSAVPYMPADLIEHLTDRNCSRAATERSATCISG